jgi:hypothetical protein
MHKPRGLKLTGIYPADSHPIRVGSEFMTKRQAEKLSKWLAQAIDWLEVQERKALAKAKKKKKR